MSDAPDLTKPYSILFQVLFMCVNSPDTREELRPKQFLGTAYIVEMMAPQAKFGFTMDDRRGQFYAIITWNNGHQADAPDMWRCKLYSIDTPDEAQYFEIQLDEHGRLVCRENDAQELAFDPGHEQLDPFGP